MSFDEQCKRHKGMDAHCVQWRVARRNVEEALTSGHLTLTKAEVATLVDLDPSGLASGETSLLGLLVNLVVRS